MDDLPICEVAGGVKIEGHQKALRKSTWHDRQECQSLPPMSC